VSFKQGDIIAISLDPKLGHGQSGFRPALVISRDLFNEITKMLVVCPITSRVKELPLRISLDERTTTKGFILCEQIRTIDSVARNPKFLERLPDDILDTVKQTVAAIFE